MKTCMKQLKNLRRLQLVESQLQYRSFNTSQQQPSRKPRNPRKEMLMNVLKLSPHILLGSLFIVTAQSHLLPIPMATGALQWMYMKRHIQNMTLYYDLYQLGNNANHTATYGKVREILLTNEELSLYIDQPREKGQDSRNLIIENPKFQPFSFTERGITGKIDEKRTRYSYECNFRDLAKNCEGRIYSLIIFTNDGQAYFETFTVFLTQPVEKTIRIQESDFNEDDKELSQFNKPSKGYQEVKPKERPKSNTRQY